MNPKLISPSERSSGGRENGRNRPPILRRPQLKSKRFWPLQNLAFNYQMQRNFDAANKTIDRALQLEAGGIMPLGDQVQTCYREKGDFSVGGKAFESPKSIPMSNEAEALCCPARAK